MVAGTIEKPIEHVKVPVALFNTDPKVGNAPLSVTFTDKSQHNPTAWYWDFGDGTTSTVQNPPVHIYPGAGIYNVRLTACNSAGCDDGERFVFTLPRFDWSGHGGKNK
jgi:PKD repeat protein